MSPPRSHDSVFHSHRSLTRPSLALLLLAAIPGCDDPDQAPDEADEADEADALDEADAPDEASAPHPSAGTLAAPAEDPSAVLPYPEWEIVAPIRMDDLKPDHFPFIWIDPDLWHDLVIARYDGVWSRQQPGTSDPLHELALDTPLYAGADGEVMACWRTAPYAEDYVDVDHKLAAGGNFLVIKTPNNRWLYYAHMQTNSIPSALCPNVSTNGGYMQCPLTYVCDSDGVVPVPAACYAASEHVDPDPQCVATDAYIPAGSRPQVHAGQYIGRMGAHGNAAMSHTHISAGTVGTVGGIDRLVQAGGFQLTFAGNWMTPLSGATQPLAWVSALGLNLANALAIDHQLIFPGGKHEKTYGDTYRLRNFSASDDADLLCHDTSTGSLYLDTWIEGAGDRFSGTNWSRAANWCTGAADRLYTGHFNADAPADVLCHNRSSGQIEIDYSNAAGQPDDVDVTAGAWCYGVNQELYIGDFDDDGIDDLLCHDHKDGRRWLDRSYDGVDGTDEPFTAGWCYGHNQRLHVGRFDWFGGDDLLCHDRVSGLIYLDITVGTGGFPVFSGTDDVVGPWCNQAGQRLFAADVKIPAQRDELVCHNSDTGMTHIMGPISDAPYVGTTSVGTNTGHCTAPDDRVRFGDVNGDDRDDLVCFNQTTGARSVALAETESSPGGVFHAPNYTWTGGWCNNPRQGLH